MVREKLNTKGRRNFFINFVFGVFIQKFKGWNFLYTFTKTFF